MVFNSSLLLEPPICVKTITAFADRCHIILKRTHKNIRDQSLKEINLIVIVQSKLQYTSTSYTYIPCIYYSEFFFLDKQAD